MYCVMETQFYCDGNAGQCAAKFNAMLGELKDLLARHPGVTCTAFDDDDWQLAADELQEYSASAAEDDATADGAGA